MLYWRIIRCNELEYDIAQVQVRIYTFARVASVPIKTGLHRNANVACENNAYVYVGKFVDCWAFAKAVY